MDSTKQLGTESISRLIWKFSLPAIVGILVSSLYNVIDRVFIGHSTGRMGIAAVAICFPIMLVQIAFGAMVGVGATTLVSIRLGEQRRDEAEHIVGNTFTLVVFISACVTVLGLIFLDPILRAIGASNEVFARLKPVLETWAGKIVHIGALGDGHRMKLINNFVSLGYAALYAEALALAEKVGISAGRFDNVIRGGRMDCGFYQTFMRWTLEGDADAHKFTIANAYKDLRYLGAMADAAGLVNSMGATTKNAFASAAAAGGAQHYVPMLATYIARANGIADQRWDELPKKE